MPKLTHATYTALLSDINVNTTAQRQRIQDALEFAAYCAQADRNADPAIRLFMVVGRETNRQNMATWLADHAPIGFKDNKPYFHERKWKEWTGSLAEFEVEIAESKRWWQLLTQASEIKDTVDIVELLRHLVKKAEREIKAGKKTVLHADVLTQLSTIANNKEYAAS